MEKNPVPFQKTAFVCTNTREPGARVACGNGGRGLELFETLKDAVRHQGLKGRVRVSKSGCLDVCEKGPNVFVFPDNVWYSGVDARDVPELLKDLVPKP